MNSLESRKQLLLAESELNRAHLAGDITALRANIRTMAVIAKSFSAVTSSAIALIVGISILKNQKKEAAIAKPSWPQSLLQGVSLISKLWSAFRPPPPPPKDEQVEK